MMDDHPRTILRDLVSRYGISLATDPVRTEGLLRDTCGTYHREIFVLVNAARQKVPGDLLAPRHSLPFGLLKDFLAKRLCDELSLSEEASRWAVESWADALGLAGEIPMQEPENIPERRELTLSATPPADPAVITWRQYCADNLESVNLGTRLQAVRDLSQAPDRETIRLLIGALENGNWQVREGAFDALTGLGDVTIPFLCEALIDTNDQVVWRVSLILGALKAKGAAGQMISLLDREGVIRECAIWSLGEIGDTSASTALLKFIHAGDPVLRHEAETALLKIGNTDRKTWS